MKIIKLIAFVLVCSFVLGACSDQLPENEGDEVAIVDNNDITE